jgi:outer membrane protein assembly factor BamB
VFASPVVAAGEVIVATENDTVYAFDAATGKQRWAQHLGPPVAARTLPCGNIGPVTGITSTPVIDAATGLIYTVAFISPGRHQLFALDLAQGQVRSSRPVDPPGDSPLVEQQRGALTLAGGTVYVPYGGLFGDCGTYHGWVIGAPAGGGDLVSYRVPCSRECGLWAPGGPTVDESGDLWVASGNSASETAFDYGNAVLRLSPDLRLLDWFAPSNWAALSAADQDLGSTSPVLLGGGLVWISGKEGTGYVLRASRLGGIGGQAFSAPACRSWAGTAYLSPMLYLACSGELLAVRVDRSGPAFAVRWRQPRNAPGAPILADGALWVVDTGSGTLAALDPAGGRQLFGYAGGSAAHFATPAAAGGRVYAVLGRKLVIVTVTTAPPRSSPVGEAQGGSN